jgi:hypothetical protein
VYIQIGLREFHPDETTSFEELKKDWQTLLKEIKKRESENRRFRTRMGG